MKTLTESILSSNGAGIYSRAGIISKFVEVLSKHFEMQGYPVEEMHGGYASVEYSPKNINDWNNRIQKVYDELAKVYNAPQAKILMQCGRGEIKKVGNNIGMVSISINMHDGSFVLVSFDYEQRIYTINGPTEIIKKTF